MPPKSKKNKPKPVKKDGEDEVMASGSSSDSEGEEITMNVDETAEIQNVEFEGFPPIDGDIEGISRLLPQLLLQAKVDIHALSRTIARQELIGCVLRPTEESAMEDSDEDVYGILTALPLHHEDLTSVLEHFRKRTMKHKATDPGCKELHTSYLRKVGDASDKRKVGYIIFERYLNLPYQIAAPSYKSLLDDIAEAGDEFAFTHYVLMSKIHKVAVDSAEAGKGKKGKKGGKTEAEGEDDVTFMNAEEEMLVKHAACHFDYEVTGESTPGSLLSTYTHTTSKKLMRPHRRIWGITKEGMAAFVESIQKL